jgi:hypothetical protein
MPAINTADVMTIGHGAVTNGLTPQDSDWILPSESNWRANSDTSLRNEDYGLSVSKNAGGMNEANTHADTIDSSSNGVRSAGVSDAPENGAGNHSISSEAGEHGTAPIHGAGVHDIEPSSIAHVVFGGLASMPGHEASFHFKDEISTPNGSGVINLAELGDTLGSISHHENSTGNHAPHEIAEIVQTIDLSLSEQHSADPFDMVAKHEGNAVVTHVPHDLIV